MSVLLLNYDYQPIHIIDWKRAINGMLSGRYKPASDDIEMTARSNSGFSIDVPKKVVLNRYINLSKRHVPWTAQNVKIRDNWSCAYCGIGLGETRKGKTIYKGDFTIDHIMPTSKGGAKKDWSNTVCACFQCNNKKGNNILEDMSVLKVKPHAPHYIDFFLRRNNQVCDQD